MSGGDVPGEDVWRQEGSCTICGGNHPEGHPFRRYVCDNCGNEVWLPGEDGTQVWCASCSPETGYRMEAQLGPGSLVRL